MITLYIDNNILGQEQYWPAIATLCESTPRVRVAISDWHMVELASIADREQVLRRADFIDSLRPLWMRGYLPIQQCEVKRFTWQAYYRVAPETPWIFTEYLSEVWSDYLGAQTVVGLNARKWVEIVRDLGSIHSERFQVVDALRTLQAATAQQKREIEKETFMRWALPRINDFDPYGKAITQSKKEELANFCYENKIDFYSSCPAMAVESKLHQIRSRDPRRRARATDAIDLFHGVLALSYCTYYVSRDGFGRECAIYATKELPSLQTANIYESVGDVSATFGNGGKS